MDNFSIMRSIARRRNRIKQTRKVAGTPDFLQLSLFFQPVGQCDKVYRFCFVKQVGDGGIDFLMGGSVEIFRGQDFDDIQQGIVIDEDGTDEGFLRFDILRRKSVRCRIFWILPLAFGH